jgi:hypothetical protein
VNLVPCLALRKVGCFKGHSVFLGVVLFRGPASINKKPRLGDANLASMNMKIVGPLHPVQPERR